MPRKCSRILRLLHCSHSLHCNAGLGHHTGWTTDSLGVHTVINNQGFEGTTRESSKCWASRAFQNASRHLQNCTCLYVFDLQNEKVMHTSNKQGFYEDALAASQPMFRLHRINGGYPQTHTAAVKACTSRFHTVAQTHLMTTNQQPLAR